MHAVLHGLLWDIHLAYLDDVIVMGKDFESHVANLAKVFSRFRKHNLKLKPKKCALIRQEVKFLGKMVSAKRLAISPENISKVQNWPTPTSTRKVEIFLRFLNYHRDHHGKENAALASPVYQLTGIKGRETRLHGQKNIRQHS